MKKYVVSLLRKYLPLIIVFIFISFFIFYFFSEDPNKRLSLKPLKKIEIEFLHCFSTETKTITDKKSIKKILKYLNDLDYKDVACSDSTRIQGGQVIIIKIKYYTKSVELVLTENRITFTHLDFHGNVKNITHCKVKNLDLSRIEFFFKEY